MKQRALLAGLLALLFWVGNRAAFEGYFSDDDLDNLSWATVAGTWGFVEELASPRFSESNTRPVGALFYQAAGRAFGLDFGKYVACLFVLHGVNCGLLWWLARKRGASETGAWAAVVLWGFHAGLLEAWWKPMYVFDLLCGTACLGTWLLFASRKTAWAVVCFLLAYRAKEVAIFLPVALALDDWRRSWPFFLVSANFGLQAMWANAGRDNNYTLRFRWESLVVTVPYYARALVMQPWAAVVGLATLATGKEALLGTAAMLVPLVFLPGRLFEVYWYVPMLPLALGAAHALGRVPRHWLALGLLLWVGLSYTRLKEKRNVELAIAAENRAYVEQMATLWKLTKFPTRVSCEGAPPGLQSHGVRGALRLISGDLQAEVLPQAEPGAAVLRWFRPRRALSVSVAPPEEKP